MSKLKNEFPHPVLSSNNQDYISGKFEFSISSMIVGNDLRIVAQYRLDSKTLTGLIEKGAADVFVKIASPKVSFRKMGKFAKSTVNTEININKYSVSEKVEVSCFVVAVEDIAIFQSDEFNRNYFQDTSFQIRKGDMLAIHNGFVVPIDATDLEGPVSSIFTISKQEEPGINVDFSEDKIIIYINEKGYDAFTELKAKDGCFKKTTALILVLPALAEAVTYVQKKENKNEEFEDYVDKRWFRMIKKKIETKKIDINALGSLSLANLLLDDMITLGLMELKTAVDSASSVTFDSGDVD